MGGGEPRSAQQVWAEWTAANESGDAATAGRLAREMTEVAPGSYHAWFEAGLHAKAVQDWAQCVAWNEQALPLFGPAEAEDFGGVDPAAWNLGIAATALGDWSTARRAWTAYGIEGLSDGEGPIDVDFGLVPVRVNPDRPSLALQVVPELGTTEVLWCWRRSPAHAVVASVPLPESGHRFRDVLLHDGEPKGTRHLGEREVSVFDELARLEDSGLPTWQARVTGASPGDVDELADLAGPRGLGADNWSGLAMLCADCSHGSPDPAHSHPDLADGTVRIGLAGAEADLAPVLDDWARPRSHLTVDEVELLW